MCLFFLSCSDNFGSGHIAKTYTEWCAQIADKDLKKENKTLLFDKKAIRNNFSETFNSAQIQIEKKTKDIVLRKVVPHLFGTKDLICILKAQMNYLLLTKKKQ
jgi:hypothetical protein